MGKNSKARRDAKVRARHRSDNTSVGVRLSDPRVGQMFGGPSVLGALFRRSCSECGSGDLSWMTPRELAGRVPDNSKARVAEAVEMVGGGAEAWLCSQCGNFGLMA